MRLKMRVYYAGVWIQHDDYRHFGESVRQNLNGHRRSFAHYCNGKQLDSNYSRSFNEIFISHIITTSFFERDSRRFYKTCHLSFWRTQRSLNRSKHEFSVRINESRN